MLNYFASPPLLPAAAPMTAVAAILPRRSSAQHNQPRASRPRQPLHATHLLAACKNGMPAPAIFADEAAVSGRAAPCALIFFSAGLRAPARPNVVAMPRVPARKNMRDTAPFPHGFRLIAPRAIAVRQTPCRCRRRLLFSLPLTTARHCRYYCFSPVFFCLRADIFAARPLSFARRHYASRLRLFFADG